MSSLGSRFEFLGMYRGKGACQTYRSGQIEILNMHCAANMQGPRSTLRNRLGETERESCGGGQREARQPLLPCSEFQRRLQTPTQLIARKQYTPRPFFADTLPSPPAKSPGPRTVQ